MSIWGDLCDAPNVGLGLTQPFSKWLHYASVYDRHLAPWRNQSLVLLEIGVSQGGSLQAWQRYLGSLAQIVGIDIHQECVALGERPGISVRIGSQADTAFLASVVGEFGVPDIVIDDGSHQAPDIQASFEFLYPQMRPNSLYFIEDCHTSYWSDFGGGIEEPGTAVNRALADVDRLNAGQKAARAQHPPPYLPDIGIPEGPDPDDFTRTTRSITFYPDIIVYEKGVTRLMLTR